METAIEHLRRGWENLFANWQLLLLRLAETVVMVLVILGGIAVTVLPVVFAGYFQLLEDLPEMQGPADFTTAHLLLLLWIAIAITVILGVALLIHSIFMAGYTGVYVEAAEAAGGSLERSRYRIFSIDLWTRHVRRSWLTVFLLYNVIWGVWGPIALVPLLFVTAALIAMGDPTALGVAGGCAIAAFYLLILVVTAIPAYGLNLTSIVRAVRDGAGTTEALRSGMRDLGSRWLELLVVWVLLIAISIGVIMVFFAFGFVVGLLGAIPLVGLLLLPLQIALSLVQNILSIVLSHWTLASFISVLTRPSARTSA